ncbi:hypothetical protein BDP55DRAFT_658227 [Colletotrichum godetiae]|uniref:Uncharacterized protein n=1 Tax=Colletotrichum godetiae TaxID=1209918 RepID=A0AAJ0ASE9_9PEZI|nr:uncharacterized protein BDP55DRAFT_658227 [Colletotrichum godetiae]KAK1687965.1 hypothetical protein BDP55DRAFT_658227 [Colletotrichum godetiae]
MARALNAVPKISRARDCVAPRITAGPFAECGRRTSMVSDDTERMSLRVRERVQHPRMEAIESLPTGDWLMHSAQHSLFTRRGSHD